LVVTNDRSIVSRFCKKYFRFSANGKVSAQRVSDISWGKYKIFLDAGNNQMGKSPESGKHINRNYIREIHHSCLTPWTGNSIEY
jgi:hypothetical protein